MNFKKLQNILSRNHATRDIINSLDIEALIKRPMTEMEKFSITVIQNLGIHRILSRKFQLLDRITKCENNGKIFVEESGMDCDCVQYSGIVREIPATLKAFEAFENDVYDNAEGPASVSILTPEEAAETSYHSRDRILEAFEDGHSHSVTMGVM